ncbi:polyketide beta-ketoacyl-synthase [Agrocybe pediades]|nr:polyketide beta-ketoacyl-synthase [Agrocybe pediades]
MASRTHPSLLIPVFGGQGSSILGASQDLGALPRTTSVSFLLDACYSAFHSEFASIDPIDHAKVGVCLSHFKAPLSIICPPYDIYLVNPAYSMPALLLNQALLYLSYVEDKAATSLQAISFTDFLQSNATCSVGVIGFSSGILAACVVATSPSQHSFVHHAVEAYRLAIWIGIQSQIYRSDVLDQGHAHSRLLPWGFVLIGLNKERLQGLVHEFNEVTGKDLVTITAVLSDKHITVSGHPEHLASFAKVLPGEVILQDAKLSALYHSPHQLQKVRDKVLVDVARRKIDFPRKTDIIVPIRCTFTGDLISGLVHTESLVERVIDMVLTQPVNWDTLVRKALPNIPSGTPVDLLNIGLGTTLIRDFLKVLSAARNVNVLDFGRQSKDARPKVKQEPIAIVGMAANMPGAANANALWELLENGRDTLREIPTERFCAADYVGNSTPGRSMRTWAANFIENVEGFDHKFFNISPREARSMDPQQRVILQTGYEALEDAGYVPSSSPTFDPATFGCYIGAATGDYVHNLRDNIDVYYSTGTLRAFLSGRLSYFLGLSGPSIVVDTACSSSFVAIHQACRALMNHDCNAALAGGVNVITSPDMFIGLDRGHFLSPSGRCRPFDAAADGYSRGEGCGMFVLKRLQDALSEKDQILGIIRGVEVNQSGNAPSVTHPHTETQANLFRLLLKNSAIDAHSINVVEAHGTGTQAGDTAEMESIQTVLALGRLPYNPLYVTSIKANIGHLEAASGSASLVKILLMFQKRIIPRQIFLETINSAIKDLALDNVVISQENVRWSVLNGGKPRIALINNFGAAGSNAAMIVEEYIQRKNDIRPPEGPSVVFGISAKDEPSLEILRSKYISWLSSNTLPSDSLFDLAYTATARRQLYPFRLAVCANTVTQLVNQLENVPISVAAEADKSVAFVFSGQGRQYYGMGQELYSSSLVFKQIIDECDFTLRSYGYPGIVEVILYQGTSSSTELAGEELQTATFSLQYALAKLWMSWGINPRAVVGHSMGEYAALVIAGVMNLKDGLLVVAKRARLMFEKCPPMATGMAAVSLGSVKIESILHSNKDFSDISISCYNSAADCVVSGPLEALEQFILYIETKAIAKVTRLRVPYGYHSMAMLPLEQDLRELGLKTETRPPRIPLISTVLGEVILPDDLRFPPKNYFARQCIEPVRFCEGVESYLSRFSSGTTTWLEISPHPTILPMLRLTPALSESLFLPSLRISEKPWTTLSQSLASLYRVDYGVNWRNVFNEMGTPTCVNLPSYPFMTQRFWEPFVEETRRHQACNHIIRYSFIQKCIRAPDLYDPAAVFQSSAKQIRLYIKGHCVGNIPLCPASVYIELAHASIISALEFMEVDVAHSDVVLHSVSFLKPLTLSPGSTENEPTLAISIDPTTSTFVLKSEMSLADQSVYARGEYRLSLRKDARNKFSCTLASVTERINAILFPENFHQLETFSARTLYQVIFSRVVGYSADFQTIQSLSMHSNGTEATANMLFCGEDHKCERYAVHPLFMDTLIHMAGFVSNIHACQTDAYICSEVGAIEVLSDTVKANTVYKLYCKISPSEDKDCMVADTYAILDDCLVAHVRGICFRRVRLGSFISGLESATRMTSSNMSGGRPIPSDVKEIVTRIVADACKLSVISLPSDQDLENLGSPTSMRQIVARILEVEEDVIRDDVPLASLGLDSLSSIEAMHALGQEFNLKVSGTLLKSGDTIRDLEAQVSSNLEPSPLPQVIGMQPGRQRSASVALRGNLLAARYQSLSLIQNTPTTLGHCTPLILIHDGSGLTISYERISPLNRRVWSITNPKFASDEQWTSLKQMAESYTNLIMNEMEGPVILGGVVAFEVAMQLLFRSFTVQGVILLDSPSPFDHVPLPPALVERVLDAAGNIEPRFRNFCKLQFMTNAKLLAEYKPSSTNLHSKLRVAFLKSKDPYNEDDVDIPAWLSDRNENMDISQGWQRMLDMPLHMLSIPGHHFQAFDPRNVRIVLISVSLFVVYDYLSRLLEHHTVFSKLASTWTTIK